MTAPATAPRTRVLGAVLAAAALVAAAGCGADASTASGPRIKVSGAFVRMPASPAVTAGYLTIRNDGDRADRLTAVSTPAAKMVQIHRMTKTDHGMTMRRMKYLRIPAHKTVRLKPGAIHLMIMHPHGLRAGHPVRLTLTFATSGKVTTTAKTTKPGATG